MLTEHLTRPPRPVPSAQRISILLVEDDDQYAAFVRTIFADNPTLEVDLTHVRHLADVMPLLGAKPFSVVLLDIDLPDGDGLDWLERHGPWLGEAVIVLTGDSVRTPSTSVAALAQDFIVKSEVQPGHLVHAVRYAVERERVRQELVRSREYFQSLIEQARDLITVVDAAGVVIYQSPASVAMLGRAPAAVIGRPLTDIVSSCDAPRVRAMLESLFAGTLAPATGEFEIQHADGTVRVLEIVASRMPAGGARQAVLNSRDVTERRQTEEMLRSRDDQLRQAMKMEAIGRLAGGIAHDFSNVLTVIIGACERLQDDISCGLPSSETQVSTIMNNCRRAASLTRQLLAFSRQQTLSPQPLDLGHLIGKSGRLLKPLIGEHIDLRVSVDPQLHAIEADPVQMEQVLLNLVINARDAMPDGGALSLRAANTVVTEEFARTHPPIPPGPYVLLEVQDTGCGMSPGTKARAFEPFFTTKGLDGTGLGLSTVYGIVKQSGGYIWISSEPGQGTTFTIHMPPSDAPAAHADAPILPTAGGAAHPATILLTEDDADVREMVATLLRTAGHTVLTAENPDGAIEVASAHRGRIDLLLTDVVMPGGTGRDLARRMDDILPGLRTLYISGYPEYGAALPGTVLEPGVAFLAKPFTRDVLIQKVSEVLALRDSRPAR